MPGILNRADSGGLADHGWLLSRHTFSFVNDYGPARNSFGLLRVFNVDIVKPGMGVGTHPTRTWRSTQFRWPVDCPNRTVWATVGLSVSVSVRFRAGG